MVNWQDGKEISIFVSDKRKTSSLSFTSDTKGSNFFSMWLILRCQIMILSLFLILSLLRIRVASSL